MSSKVEGYAIIVDNFTEQFILRARTESLNGGPAKPAGTVAAAVLWHPYKTPRSQSQSRKFRRLRRILRETTAPIQDVERLIVAVGSELIVVERHCVAPLWRHLERNTPLAHPVLALALRQLPLVREIVEAIMQIPPDATGVAPASKYVKSVAQMVRWIRCTKKEDHFLVTPAGAVVLSGIYGCRRGGLFVCAACGRFESTEVQGFRRRYCEACRRLSHGQDDETTGLRSEKRKRLKLVLDRMRKRRDRTGELIDQEDWLIWESTMRRALNAVTIPEELNAWENEFVPERSRGRPRKDDRA